MADHFNFLFCTLYVYMVMPPYVTNSQHLCAWFGIRQLFCLTGYHSKNWKFCEITMLYISFL